MGLLLIFFYGCAGYGKITARPWGETVKIGDLASNQDGYDIYYAGWYTVYPPCLIFDPKDDGRKLVGDTWYKAEDPDWISDQISWIKSFSQSFPTIQRIYGPDNGVYGFLYCDGGFRTVAKVVDESTIYIFNPFVPWTER